MRRLRSSIAGLMVIVLLAVVGRSALLSPSAAWAGALSEVTYGMFGLAIVGAICRRGAARAWWLGFCVFGLGYTATLGLSPSDYVIPQMPTSQFLLALRPAFGHPVETVGAPLTDDALTFRSHYLRIGHALVATLAALLGGIIARIFLALPADRSGGPEPGASAANRRRWPRPALIAWAALVPVCAAAAIRSGPDAGPWSGATFLLSCGLLGLAGLAAIFGRGRRRQAAVGAALFGAGYMFLVFGHAPYQLEPSGSIVAARSVYQPLPTSSILEGLRRWTAGVAGGNAAANARILEALEQPVEMAFPDPTRLDDVLRYVSMATATPTYPGIPIYLDPIGLQEAERSPSSEVTFDVRGLPLKTSLRLCLEQHGLGFCVLDGYLRVTSGDYIMSEPDDPYLVAYHPEWNTTSYDGLPSDLHDPFLIVGHCLLALLAAGFGAIAAPLVADACIPSTASPGIT